MIISYFDCLLSNLTVKERYKKFLGKYNNYSDNTFVNTVNCTFWKRGHLSPKTSTIKGSNRHLTEAGLQPGNALAERCCLLHIEPQGPRRFPGRSTFCMRYGFGGYRVSNSQIFTFLIYFLHTKCLKYFVCVAYNLAVKLQNVSIYSV